MPKRNRYSKSVLITGGAGFIGGNFTRYLYRRYPEYRLLVLDALNYAANVANLPESELDSDRLEFSHGDVCDGELVDSLVGRADAVVHFAAETAVTRSFRHGRIFFEANVLGTQTVAEAVANHSATVERFLYISSSEVYGTAQSQRIDEDHPLCPTSPYAATKCSADRLVYSYWRSRETPVIIIRSFNNYGPRQHLEKLVPRFIASCMLGEPLTVHGDGAAARDFLHVDDHCRALDLLLHAPSERVVGEIFNLGTGRHTTVVEMAHAICSAMGSPQHPMNFVEERPGQVLRQTADFSKACRTLGWEPWRSLEDGLRETIAWYRDHEELWRPQLQERQASIAAADGRLVLY